jgi:hypothetical protein
MRTWNNFIPTWSGKRKKLWEVYTREWDRDISRGIFLQKRKENIMRKLRIEEHRIYIENQKRIWAEVIDTILHDSYLSQSSWNPAYYPPVPQYTIPTGRSYTWDEIRVIQKAKKDARLSFVRDYLTITQSPMPSERFQEGIDFLNWVDPRILGSTIIYQRDIDVITGSMRIPDFLYLESTSQVGYLVNLLVDPQNKTPELIGVYVYQNPTILRELLDFLTNLDVSNPDDLMEARITLSELYWSITPKA